jgi:hypothetical protein
MSINPGAAIPFGSKNLGDLSKNTPAVNQLLTAILKAFETVGAHKFMGRKQGVSCCFIFPPFYSLSIFNFISFFLSSLHGLRWQICYLDQGQHVSCIRGQGTLMISRTRCCRQSKQGTHSSSNNPNDHEDLLEVDKLSVCLYVEYQEVVDIQEATRQFTGEGEHPKCLQFFSTKSSTPSSLQ